MADESVMNISHHISASLVLGSVLVAATPAMAEEVGVSSVELIPFPEDSTSSVNASFSGDGQLRLLYDFGGQDSLIYSYVGGEWVLIRREVISVLPGLTAIDASSDGSRIVLSDFVRVDVVDGPTVITLPREWTYTDQDGRVQRVYGTVSGGGISGNGEVVTLSGRQTSSNVSDSLIWADGGELINISDGLPRGEISYSAGMPDEVGAVVAFGSTFHGSINNIRSLWSSHGDAWVWEDGAAQRVEHLDPGYDVLMQLRAISGNGEAVIGTAQGIWRAPGAFDEPLTMQSQGLVRGPELSWIWTQASGTQQITSPQFSEMTVVSINHDASIVLGRGKLVDGTYDSFLWFRNGKALLLSELFHTLNITIDADFYAFNEISDDGTKLMGLASVNGETYSHAIIVTIPDLAP